MNMTQDQEKNTSNCIKEDEEEEEEEEEVPLPGFRFHPTDEELVGFYLRRKVDNKPLSIELIKQVDIYKFDPWDLPKPSCLGDKEGYFFCKRGRKYRNSIRPNRVTGSGFWKATGIDKPVYSHGGEGHDCIGLKKTLVYYRGSAGKGTKTDWMMHEFRLPTTHDNTNTNLAKAKISPLEYEVWTLCRIFKRNTSQKKYTMDWKHLSTRRQAPVDTSSVTCSVDSSSRESYLSFGAPQIQHDDTKPAVVNYHLFDQKKQLQVDQQWSFNNIIAAQQPASMSSSNNVTNPYANDFFTYADWDELRSVVDFALDHHP